MSSGAPLSPFSPSPFKFSVGLGTPATFCIYFYYAVFTSDVIPKLLIVYLRLFDLSRLHALKDEMFLRTSLQRQSAKLQHAAITYAVSLLLLCLLFRFIINM